MKLGNLIPKSTLLTIMPRYHHISSTLISHIFGGMLEEFFNNSIVNHQQTLQPYSAAATTLKIFSKQIRPRVCVVLCSVVALAVKSFPPMLV